MQHCDDDVLALVALGESPSSADAAHLAGCPDCREEVNSMHVVVSTVRVPTADGPPVPPPQRVWDEIAMATGVEVRPRSAATDGSAGSSAGTGLTAAAGPASDLSRPTRRGRRRRQPGSRPALLAVAASALVVGVVGGVVGSHLLRADPPAVRQQVVAQISLAAFPVDPGARGEAAVLTTPSGRALKVDVSRLAGTNGFYEVWLIDRGVKKMIPLGILRGDRGEFSIPAGVDLGQYPIVDVSAEPLDGNPQHSGKSLLRGTIAG